MVEKEHLIDLVGISKEFDGVQVLKNINLYIRKKGTRKSLAAMGPYISLGAATAMVFPLLETLLNFKI